MKILYRFSEATNGKNRPPWFNKINVLGHFLSRFGEHEIFVFADNITAESYGMLRQIVKDPDDHLIVTYLGNARSFLYVAQFALDNFNDDNEIIYFAEDDYVYRKNADVVLMEGLECVGADYVTGYDHPDKYISYGRGGDNPELDDDGEKTVVFMSPLTHWKITNSTTMTFALKLRTLREDFGVMALYCQGDGVPCDYEMFVALRREKNRRICSPIPGYSTHCEVGYLAPLIDWEGELDLFDNVA